jgi:archaellum component FlaF (FlaF/FlaG flagellin family)
MMDYLQAAQPSQSVNVVVANAGTAPVTVYAVWLNGSRIQVEQVLAPGDSLSVPFDLGSSGSALEVRVVTSTRAHVARLVTKSAAP